METPAEVERWLRVAVMFLKAQKEASEHKFEKADVLLSSLIQNVLSSSRNEDPDLTQLTDLVDLLFVELTDSEQGKFVEAIVTNMQQRKRAAFNCLERLLDTQIQKQESTCFLKFLPLFILPTIKAIQLN